MMEQISSSERSESLCTSSGEPDACLSGAPSQACRATSSPSGAASSHEGNGQLTGDAPDAANETLEQFLESERAGRLGWDPLFAAVNFLSIAVDVRSLGWLLTADRAEYERYRAFVHTLRAAIQAYLLPDFRNPALASEAERYLGSGPSGIPIFAPATATETLDELPVLASGLIVTGLSLPGDSSRISSVRTLVTRISRLLAPLSEDALEQDVELAHQRLKGDGRSEDSDGPTKSEQIAALVLRSFISGFCIDALREQGFQWRLDRQVPRLYRETFAALESERLGGLDHEMRPARLRRIAENIIRGAFKAFGLKIPPGLLRDRRTGRTS